MELILVVLAVVLGVPMLVAFFTRREGQSFSERMGEVGDALQSGGQRMQQLGCGLTLAVTVPLLGLIFAGTLGLVVGAAIGLAFGVGMIGSALSGEKPGDDE